MAGPYYTNTKLDNVDYLEASDLEAIETGFSDVDTDKANKAVPGTVGEIATLSAAGDLTASGMELPTGDLVGTTDTQTLTNKTVDLTDNTLTGTTAEFNTALSDGTFATLAGTETLTNKTLTAVVLDGGYSEEVYALSGTTPALDPANGSIQTWTLGGNSTPTDSLSAGESILLMVDDGSSYGVTWPSVTWLPTGTAPTLQTSGYNVISLWKVGSSLYGSYQG